MLKIISILTYILFDIYLAGNIEASIKNPPVTMAKRKAVMYITKRAMKIGYLHE